MRKIRSAEDLSIEELRRLLVEKRRRTRQEHLERFRRTGRVLTVASDVSQPSLDDLKAERAANIQIGAGEVRSRTRWVLDGLLLLVEIAAVVGLVFVVVYIAGYFQELNQEYEAGLTQPTLTPTPLIMAVVLPGGHTPPDSPGGAQPNEAEIPEVLRPRVQALANIPIPTQAPGQAIRIQVRAINVDAPIVQGDSWEELKKGVGQHIGTANPGEKGNVFLTAHNDVFGEIFRDLDKLKPGDQIIIYTYQRSYTYVVTDPPTVIDPYRVEFMNSTADPIVTLHSCYPYLKDNQRIIVRAKLQDSER